MIKSQKLISFFSGAGILDLGFEDSGYEVIYVNEINEQFLDIYRYSRKMLNISEPLYGYYQGDIVNFTSDKLKKLLKKIVDDVRREGDVIGFIGGPPCPDFSIGGKNRGRTGDNGKLSETYINVICQQKPDFFVFENVKGLWKTKKHRLFYDYLKQQLNNAGFKTTERLINSLEYGVPQDRERIILIGFHKEFLLKCSKKYLLGKPFPWEDHIKYTLTDVFSCDWPETNPFKEDSILPCPNNIIKELTVEYSFKKNDVNNHPNSVLFFKPRAGISRFKSVYEGDDSRKSFKRLHRWRYSPTVCYGNNEVHLHPYKARRLTVSEAMALQSLPYNFVIPDHVSLTNAFKAIGNGVPYLAAKEIANTILSYLE